MKVKLLQNETCRIHVLIYTAICTKTNTGNKTRNASQMAQKQFLEWVFVYFVCGAYLLTHNRYLVFFSTLLDNGCDAIEITYFSC